jgi:dTDP-glucose 4,6-dehydratase
VDRSIDDPVHFIRNNVGVVLSTLELCRAVRPEHVILISTDEVYGPMTGDVPHTEWSPILPSNPYAASKAAQEAIAISYWRTYGLPLTIVNCMNLIGERQDAEKFVPMLIKGITRGEEVTIHGRLGDIGSRYYLHARNLASALVHILTELPPAAFPAADRPDRFNVVGPDRVSNLELAEQIATIAGRSLWYRLVDFHSARPGHDPHYGLDNAKLTAAGWKPTVPFGESLTRTVQWSLLHPEWLS